MHDKGIGRLRPRIRTAAWAHKRRSLRRGQLCYDRAVTRDLGPRGGQPPEQVQCTASNWRSARGAPQIARLAFLDCLFREQTKH